MVNLDYLAAKYAFQASRRNAIDFKKLDNDTTTALNILHEQGIYAMFLWLNEKKRENEASALLTILNDLFHDSDAPFSIAADKDLRTMNAVSECLTRNLKSMFLAKNLIELTLIYIRHTAKANKN